MERNTVCGGQLTGITDALGGDFVPKKKQKKQKRRKDRGFKESGSQKQQNAICVALTAAQKPAMRVTDGLPEKITGTEPSGGEKRQLAASKNKKKRRSNGRKLNGSEQSEISRKKRKKKSKSLVKGRDCGTDEKGGNGGRQTVADNEVRSAAEERLENAVVPEAMAVTKKQKVKCSKTKSRKTMVVDELEKKRMETAAHCALQVEEGPISSEKSHVLQGGGAVKKKNKDNRHKAKKRNDLGSNGLLHKVSNTSALPESDTNGTAVDPLLHKGKKRKRQTSSDKDSPRNANDVACDSEEKKLHSGKGTQGDAVVEVKKQKLRKALKKKEKRRKSEANLDGTVENQEKQVSGGKKNSRDKRSRRKEMQDPESEEKVEATGTFMSSMMQATEGNCGDGEERPCKKMRIPGSVTGQSPTQPIEHSNGAFAASEELDHRKNELTSGSRAFRRVVTEQWMGKKGAIDNSYTATHGHEGWGAKAHFVLGSVRGKDFRHEKTKKKRGTYRGGRIDGNAVRSYKFDSDDD